LYVALASMADLKHRDADVLLSETGQRQIKFKLTTKPADFEKLQVQVVLCSPMRRALQTAIAAYPKHSIVVDTRLREVEATSGMLREELRMFLARHGPDVVERVDLTRVSLEAPWWGPETPETLQNRLQSLLKAVRHFIRAGQLVALVGHSVALQRMVGFPLKPFPQAWGAPRGWPKNFRPYFGCIEGNRSTGLRIGCSPISTATLVLVRHAHSDAQAARSAQKKLKRKHLEQAETWTVRKHASVSEISIDDSQDSFVLLSPKRPRLVEEASTHKAACSASAPVLVTNDDKLDDSDDDSPWKRLRNICRK